MANRKHQRDLGLIIMSAITLIILTGLICLAVAAIKTEAATPTPEAPADPPPVQEPTPEYSWDDVETLARLIYWEAGDDTITDRHQQLVACVALNRVASQVFPDTLDGVIAQPGQYAVARQVQAGLPAEIPARCVANALLALNGSVDCPPDVVYQAEFRQGAVYEVHATSYSTTYFCMREE